MLQFRPRRLPLPVPDHSFFLFGPRQTGKTTLIKRVLGDRPFFEANLLHGEVLARYKARPALFREEVSFFAGGAEKPTVFVDEIQRAPELLDEIHFLLEEHQRRICFVLTGSSARKLKRVSANLLAGRVWDFRLYPLTHDELGADFRLDDVLRFGSLPALCDLDELAKVRTLQAYVGTYLQEEIIGEALVRNVGAFSRFLDLACEGSGELVNFSNIARETGTASKTVKEYYQILEDTLVCLRLDPYLRSTRKKVVAHSKYYLFDLGVINAGCGRLHGPVKRGTSLYGRLFEHFVILELHRLIRYAERPWRMHFWRTSHGAEVDLVLGLPDDKTYAIEIKSADHVDGGELRALRRFGEEFPSARLVCVTNGQHPHELGNVTVMPWQYFLSRELGLVSPEAST